MHLTLCTCFQIEQTYAAHADYLQQTINHMSAAKHSSDILDIVHQLDRYISQHEAHQLDQLKRLATLSEHLHGLDNTIETYSRNIELFQSLFTVKNELTGLHEQLADSEQAAIEQAAIAQAIQSKCTSAPSAVQQPHAYDVADSSPQVRVTDQQRVVRYDLCDNAAQQIEQQTVKIAEPPHFVEHLADAALAAGEKCTFACRFAGTQPITTIWLKNDSPISNYPQYSVHNDSGRASLTIHEACAEDAATFTCHISNCYGSATTSAHLTVQHDERYCDALVPPHFTRPLTDCTADAGSSVCWSCFVEGNPLPTIQWFKDDRCLDVEPRYDISFNNGESILRLDDVSASDAGHYTIVARNEVGTDQCSGVLNVLAPQPVRSLPPPIDPSPPQNGKFSTLTTQVLTAYALAEHNRRENCSFRS